MDNAETINVLVGGEKIIVPLKFMEVSEYMRSLQALGFDEEQQIEVDSVPKQIFEEILKFYELSNYQQVFIKTPIKTSNIRDVLTNNISDYIQKYPIESPEFKSLVKACEFLGCRNLLRVCATRCACLVYFQDSKEAFEQKQKQLKVKVKVEFEDNQKFKKLYPFMNS